VTGSEWTRRHLAKLVIAGLCVALIAVYATDRRTIQRLRAELGEREQAAQRLRDEYETKLATLRAEQAERARADASGAAGAGLLGMLLSAPALARPYDQESFREIVRTLGIEAEQERRIVTILDQFTAARREVVVRATQAGSSVSAAPHADAMRRLQRDTLAQLRQTLNPAQYAELLRRGYDQTLGLREAPR
jgi:ABC-type Fe2+-enterobactin transport system substrate-binding protein